MTELSEMTQLEYWEAKASEYLRLFVRYSLSNHPDAEMVEFAMRHCQEMVIRNQYG
jgi:hypothetical protein